MGAVSRDPARSTALNRFRHEATPTVTARPDSGIILGRNRVKLLLAVKLVLGSLALSCTGQPPVSPSLRSPIPAANLLSPAPRPTVHTLGRDCNVGVIRANHVGRGELLDVLGPYVPTWLPNGFGLLDGFRGSGRGMENGNGAIWTDAACRQVHLEFLPHVAHEESPRPADQWALIS